MIYKTDLAEVEVRKGEILKTLDTTDTNSVISFGTSAQAEVNTVAEKMLENVKSKDLGPIGDVLVGMVTQMRGLDFSKVQPGKKPNFFSRLLGKVTPLAEFIQSYEDISVHINVIIADLESHKLKLMKDVKMLDTLYITTLQYFHDIELHIEVLKSEISRFNETVLPALKAKAETDSDPLLAQDYRDKSAIRDALERRLSDLEMTRTVTMQALPSIRMVQTNDSDLINKINSQVLNSIPSWNQQFAIAVAAWRTADAAASTKAVSDYSNELLVRNAELLKMGNAAARNEVERGVYDIEAIEKANNLLIEAINDTISIAAQGKEKRQAAQQKLTDCEAQLKQALLGAAVNLG